MSLALEFIGLAGWLTILAVYRFDWDNVIANPPFGSKRAKFQQGVYYTPRRVLVRVRWAWRRMRRSIKSLP